MSMKATTQRAMRWLAAAAVLGGLSFFDPASAEAQRPGEVIELDALEIEGRVQKPNAFYILNRSQLGYEVLDSTHQLRARYRRDRFSGPPF